MTSSLAYCKNCDVKAKPVIKRTDNLIIREYICPKCRKVVMTINVRRK